MNHVSIRVKPDTLRKIADILESSLDSFDEPRSFTLHTEQATIMFIAARLDRETEKAINRIRWKAP